MNPIRWGRERVAFNFMNKEFRKNRHLVRPLSTSIYNNKFTSNGGHGVYEHDKTNLVKIAGREKLIKEKEINEEINFDELKIIEKTQINFKGAELKGKRITNKKEALQNIKNLRVKYNRGGNAGGRRSGLFSGGLAMREYEKEQVRLSSQDFEEPVEDDEFETLQSRIQEQEQNTDIMISGEGL